MPNMSLKKTPMPEQAPDVRNKNFEEVALGYDEVMAVGEAQRCLNCKNKPCVSGCPVMISIPEFIAHVAKLYQSQARALAELAKGENLAPVQQTEDAKNTNATGKGDAPVEDATRKFDFGELQFGTEYDPKDVK